MTANAALLQAYQNSRYRVWLSDTQILDLHPGQPHTAMDAALQSRQVSCGHLISACNPRSQACSSEENQHAMQRLHRQIQQAGWAFLPAQGQALDDSWPPEDSLFLLGMQRAHAVQLAEQFGQYALLEHCLGNNSQLLFSALWPNRQTG